MALIKPFPGYLANPVRVKEIVAPPYDSLTPRERHRFAVEHPSNYLNAMRAQEEFPEGETPPLEDLLQANAVRLKQMIADGNFVHHPQPAFYLYRLAVDDHAQIGLVAEASVADYERGLIKKHEHTRSDKEDALTRYREVVRVSSSPICLAYAQDAAIEALLAELTQAVPVIDFVADDGVRQTIWMIGDGEIMQQLAALFSRVSPLYLTDGHHRCAAAARLSAKMRANSPNHSGEEPYNSLLVALFPDSELRILSYNRCVKDLNGHSEQAFLAALARDFEIATPDFSCSEDAEPRKRAEIAMLLRGIWYRLNPRPGIVPADDPVGSLDACVLQDRILGPLLGIEDPRADPRIDYIAGSFKMKGLQERCRAGWDLAFALYPTAIEGLMAIADRGEVMPPKSTWFDPKARSGLFLRLG